MGRPRTAGGFTAGRVVAPRRGDGVGSRAAGRVSPARVRRRLSLRQRAALPPAHVCRCPHPLPDHDRPCRRRRDRPQVTDHGGRHAASDHWPPLHPGLQRFLPLDGRPGLPAAEHRPHAEGAPLHAERVRRPRAEARVGALGRPRRPQRARTAARRKHEAAPRPRRRQQLLGSASVRRPRRLRHDLSAHRPAADGRARAGDRRPSGLGHPRRRRPVRGRRSHGARRCASARISSGGSGARRRAGSSAGSTPRGRPTTTASRS